MTSTKADSVRPKFCSQCQNLMLPVEGDDNRLYFKCRRCEAQQEVLSIEDNRVFIQNFGEVQSDTVEADVRQDPTYPKTVKECPKCHQNEAVFYHSSQWGYNCSLRIFYRCLHCGKAWAEGGEQLNKEHR
ncbi:DNA-directed RNA polymerase II subunit [Entamoeba marina]